MTFWPERLLFLHPEPSAGPKKEHFCLGREQVAGCRGTGWLLGPGVRAACCSSSVSLPGFSPAAVTSSPPWPHPLCPSPQGPWACGFPSIFTVLKLYKRQQRLATARPVEPKTGNAWIQGMDASVSTLALLKSHSTVFCSHSLIFGAITCFTGFLGVVTGAGATRWCRLRTQRADPLVCAVGMLGSAIFICLIFVAAKTSIVGAYVSPQEVGGDRLEAQSDLLDPLSP